MRRVVALLLWGTARPMPPPVRRPSGAGLALHGLGLCRPVPSAMDRRDRGGGIARTLEAAWWSLSFPRALVFMLMGASMASRSPSLAAFSQPRRMQWHGTMRVLRRVLHGSLVLGDRVRLTGGRRYDKHGDLG